jgi:L-ascorbate metabolism protein UlaG (beta-lactamase superfamily)
MLVTRIGGPTLLVELDGWRILIDPTFDPPGRRYRFGLGASSVKTRPPAVAAEDLGPIDLVLVSHDQHADNLDDAGRALLPGAAHVLTTVKGASRLGLPNTRGLAPGQTVHLLSPRGPGLDVTATPCRHGPPLSRPIVGDAIGFAIRRPGRSRHDLWVSGDTVLYPALLEVAAGLDTEVAIVNGGGVKFGVSGPIRYTMTGVDVLRLVKTLQPRVVIPAHYDGWSHFVDGEDGIRTAAEAASPEVRARFRWLPDGIPTEV